MPRPSTSTRKPTSIAQTTLSVVSAIPLCISKTKTSLSKDLFCAVGGQEYVLQNDGAWKRAYSGVERPAFTCQWLAQGTRVWIAPDMEEMLTHGIIEKGEKKTG